MFFLVYMKKIEIPKGVNEMFFKLKLGAARIKLKTIYIKINRKNEGLSVC